VQRVSVKIVLDGHNPKGLLRPGMSAVPTVHQGNRSRRT
jgi:multidrug resistance efflux pump